jgi:hypothetical protein
MHHDPELSWHTKTVYRKGVLEQQASLSLPPCSRRVTHRRVFPDMFLGPG